MRAAEDRDAGRGLKIRRPEPLYKLMPWFAGQHAASGGEFAADSRQGLAFFTVFKPEHTK
jgi:hypothetical protein